MESYLQTGKMILHGQPRIDLMFTEKILQVIMSEQNIVEARAVTDQVSWFSCVEPATTLVRE